MKTLGAQVVIALALWPNWLLAQPAPAPIYVSARLAPECRSANDFAQRLLARTHRLRWANPGEPGILFDISAYPARGGYIGQLQIRELDGRFTDRAIEGRTCDGVINALAFVAAVLVDPEAAARAEPPAPEAPPPPIIPPPPTPIEAPRVFGWGIGISTGITSATAPQYQLIFGGRVTAAWNGSGFSPWVSVGFEERIAASKNTLLDPTPNQIAATSFGGWLTHLALSPIRWPGTGQYFVRPVALFEIGRLTTNTTAPNIPTFVAQNQGPLWLAPGLGAVAEAQIFPPLSVFADLNARIPLSHRSYLIRTPNPALDVQVYPAPYVGWTARLGVTVQFK